jgi:hypothetical protein
MRVHSGVAQRPGNDLYASIVTIEAHFCEQNAD